MKAFGWLASPNREFFRAVLKDHNYSSLHNLQSKAKLCHQFPRDNS